MPQMMPLTWLLMLFFMSMIIIMTISFIYFLPIFPHLNMLKLSSSISPKWFWKW
uniref:ATP synthase F0 subunit 8 n=1 Tax=Cardiocondyla obscurior TaxID=286306 RepID=A0A343AXU1_9HYME|nr:ATP synthase F0 subunit 8 [Cardiocondyla obscurior]